MDDNDVPPDSDGDGICDSEDDDDTGGPTTLGEQIIQFAYQPVTLWMLTIGVIVSLFLGMSATTMSVRRDREIARGDHTSSVESGLRRRGDYSWDGTSQAAEIPVPTTTTPVSAPVEDTQTRLQKLIDQGYSPEVAQVIMENEDN